MPTIASNARQTGKQAEVADLEVALLEVLERDALAVVGVARQVHLAVLAEGLAVRPDQDRGVVAVRCPGLTRELGVAEVEADAEVPGEIEQRRGRGVRHLALEPGVDRREVVVPVAREEGGERQLREDHQLRPHAVGLAQHRAQAPDHARAVVREVDRAELGRRDLEPSRHRFLPSRSAPLTLGPRSWPGWKAS
jgi:hypothetical protein